MARATGPFLELRRVQGPQLRSPWLEHWALLQVGRPGAAASQGGSHEGTRRQRMGQEPTNRASQTSQFSLKTSPAALYPRVNIKMNDYKLIVIHAMGENNYEKRGRQAQGGEKKSSP